MGLLLFRVNWSRVGLKAVVLEQSNKLRAEGVTIALYTNGMRVLQILGLADRFRNTSINISRYVSVVDSLSSRVSNLCMFSIMRRLCPPPKVFLGQTTCSRTSMSLKRWCYIVKHVVYKVLYDVQTLFQIIKLGQFIKIAGRSGGDLARGHVPLCPIRSMSNI